MHKNLLLKPFMLVLAATIPVVALAAIIMIKELV
jgi:hypothetical protein